MGYAFYFVGDRPAGYGVLATCDKRGCNREINRGLGYLCGQTPHGYFDDEFGCGMYFCDEHYGFLGPRGGCRHRQRQAWGETLACMAVLSISYPDHPEWTQGSTYCLYRKNHDGPHAWDAIERRPASREEKP